MLINLKVKTLDAQTHEFSNIDNEITVREFKDKIAETTNIAADQQRIIYCGRVLADEKQLKEYDVDGKVLHVAERPPPSQRAPSTSNSNDTPRERSTARGMRNSPLFRALDGMVVGTMAIPMNAGGMNNAQMPINPFTSSSSFCMNRITVARHMLECANNIAAYLEDPERGLNNTSLDILARGRWTMESTVVEVGITAADLPQNQNFVDVVQGAVSAALRRNGNNVTVVQLPTVFGSSESGGVAGGSDSADDGAAAAAANSGLEMLTNAVASGQHAPTAAVIIEDVIDADDEDGGTNASSNIAQAGSNSNSSGGSAASTANTVIVDGSSTSGAVGVAPNNSTSSTGTNTDENLGRRRTGTNVLAEVVDQMRNVQTRLNPFIQQFYDLLQNEPTFEENDTTARENAQRLYDRVSEAFHYMSHAQHAISDLMLDVSQPAPRFLTCRPILVEQSGYVSSNNYLSAAAAAAAAALRHQQQHQQAVQQQLQQLTAPDAPQTTGGSSDASGTVRMTPTPTTSGNAATTSSNTADNAAVEDPVDDPVIELSMPALVAAGAEPQNNDNHQMQMARLLQAVVNSAPVDTEFHVQINAPSIVTFGMNPAERQQAQQQQQQQSATSDNNSNEGNAAATTTSPATPTATSTAASAGNNQAHVNTATLPTTSTQTRSTSRPQLQIGNIPGNGWNGRFIPSNMMSSFDRFLPCNSHHIHEAESANGNATNGNNTNAAAATTAVQTNSNAANTNNQRNARHISNIMRSHASPIVGSTMASPRTGNNSNNNVGVQNDMLANSMRRNLQRLLMPSITLTGQALHPSQRTASAPNAATAIGTDGYRRNLRRQLYNFVAVNILEGGPNNEETMLPAINRIVRWFGEHLIYLPQYEKPEYDSRDSVINILRRTLPLLINLLSDSQENPLQFEQRLKQLCEEFMKRLFSVLHVCVGPANAALYWPQLMRSLLVPIRSNFRDEALQFLCIYINPDIPSNTDTSDAQQFIVERQTPDEKDKPTPMDTDVEMSNVASTSEAIINTNHSNASGSQLLDDGELEADIELEPAETLPDVVVGSESWHCNFPSNWLPIIARDIRTQAENPPIQPPFSDAYISGMSAKRRKMIQSNKPPTDVGSLVAESVRRAIQTVGVSTSTASNQSQTPDDITNAIANDSAVQASYTEAARTNIRERLKKDPDYSADKYPQTTKFINHK